MNRRTFHKALATSIALTGTDQKATAGEATTIFKGVPIIKISEGGVARFPESLPREKAINVACIISKIGTEYYWATRENKLLVRAKSGAYLTYIAIDGSGYVRVIPPESKQLASLAGPTESEFDYVEHLLLGLTSVTYYGRSE